MSGFRHRGVIQDYEGDVLEGAEISIYIQAPVNVKRTIGSGNLTEVFCYMNPSTVSSAKVYEPKFL